MKGLPQGWFHVGDIKQYRSLIEQIPDGGVIAELGVWKGRSLCSIADLIQKKNLKVYAIDTFKGSKGDLETYNYAKEHDVEGELRNNLKEFGIEATILPMTTHEASIQLRGIKFDLVLIDADHTYLSVKQDISDWLPLCKGFMVGHDYELNDVSSAVDEFFKNVHFIHNTTQEGRGTMWWHDVRQPDPTEKMVDVIIPAYKAQKTIERTLCSIVMQSIVNKLSVIIVNDCDGIGYQKFVDQFKEFVEIKEVTLPENVGPGVARQAGIDASTSPYFTCIDADDTFVGAFALETLFKHAIIEPEYHTVIGTFIEQRDHLQFIAHNQDMVWTFGKLYKREFINKYQIRFNETRANEDTGFNTIIRLVSSETEKIKFIPDVVYCWHSKGDSITRINYCQYSYDQSFVGYTDNMIYAVTHARKVKPFSPHVDMWAIQAMAQLYNYYFQTVKRDPRFIEQNYKSCLKYYREIYKEVANRIPQQSIDDIFSQVFVDQAQSMQGVVPSETIHQWLARLEREDADALLSHRPSFTESN